MTNNKLAKNGDTGLMQLNMNKNWRANFGQPTFARVKYLAITNRQLQPCLPSCLIRGTRCHAVGFLPFQQAHLWPFETQRTLQQLCCFLRTTYCSTSQIPKSWRQCHESSRDIIGSYYALKGHSAAGQGGSPRSSPLRSDGSQDDQVGEAGPVEP